MQSSSDLAMVNDMVSEGGSVTDGVRNSQGAKKKAERKGQVGGLMTTGDSFARSMSTLGQTVADAKVL